jgi:hypothetical protein
MWCIDQITFQARTLDFGPSGLGQHPTTAVVGDGVELVNALNLLDLTDEPIQMIVCDCCGTPGCNSGSRVAYRRLEDALLVIPAFEAMSRGTWEQTEYAPPHFIDRMGAPLVRGQALESLKERVPGLADPARWPQVSRRELAMVLQWEAPARVLGVFPGAPKLSRDLIAAATHGAGEEAQDALEALLSATASEHGELGILRCEPVTFYLDLPGFPEWQPLAFDGERFHLAIAPGWGVRFVDGPAQQAVAADGAASRR